MLSYVTLSVVMLSAILHNVIETRAQYYKTVYGRNLWMLVIS